MLTHWYFNALVVEGDGWVDWRRSAREVPGSTSSNGSQRSQSGRLREKVHHGTTAFSHSPMKSTVRCKVSPRYAHDNLGARSSRYLRARAYRMRAHNGHVLRCHSVGRPPLTCPPGQYSLGNIVPPDIIH